MLDKWSTLSIVILGKSPKQTKAENEKDKNTVDCHYFVAFNGNCALVTFQL